MTRRARRDQDTKIAVAAPEFGRIWGGIGTYLGQLLPGIAPRHEVTILCGQTPAFDTGYRTVPLANGGGVMANYFKFQRALQRRWPDLVREYRPDLLVVHHAQMPDLWTDSMACPTVVTTHTTILGQARGIQGALRHGGPLDDSERTTLAVLPALLPIELYYWNRVRHVLFVSDAVRREVVGTYDPRLQTSALISNGLALDELRAAGGKPEAPDEPGFILFTGRLLGWKGLAVLLRAMAHLRRPERLVVTGSGRVGAWRRYARSLGLGADRVEFLGAIPRSELLSRLRRATMVALPSYMESCPYSLIEAMAFEKPIVATAIPGTLSMVEDGVSALLVPPGDPRALAEAIDRLLGDETLRRRVGKAAASVARERFSSDRMCAETLRYFEQVLAAS